MNKKTWNDGKVTLKKVKLVKDGGYGYALDITWTVETPERVQELHIPRVWLPIKSEAICISYNHDYLYGGTRRRIDIGFGPLPVGFDNAEPEYTLTTIKEKTQEMTLEEIEKKLGHKVKIVTKEMK